MIFSPRFAIPAPSEAAKGSVLKLLHATSDASLDCMEALIRSFGYASLSELSLISDPSPKYLRNYLPKRIPSLAFERSVMFSPYASTGNLYYQENHERAKEGFAPHVYHTGYSALLLSLGLSDRVRSLFVEQPLFEKTPGILTPDATLVLEHDRRIFLEQDNATEKIDVLVKKLKTYSDPAVPVGRGDRPSGSREDTILFSFLPQVGNSMSRTLVRLFENRVLRNLCADLECVEEGGGRVSVTPDDLLFLLSAARRDYGSRKAAPGGEGGAKKDKFFETPCSFYAFREHHPNAYRIFCAFYSEFYRMHDKPMPDLMDLYKYHFACYRYQRGGSKEQREAFLFSEVNHPFSLTVNAMINSLLVNERIRSFRSEIINAVRSDEILFDFILAGGNIHTHATCGLAGSSSLLCKSGPEISFALSRRFEEAFAVSSSARLMRSEIRDIPFRGFYTGDTLVGIFVDLYNIADVIRYNFLVDNGMLSGDLPVLCPKAYGISNELKARNVAFYFDADKEVR